MTSSIYIPKPRIRGKHVDIFPYWIGFLLICLLVGAVGAYQVLRYGLAVTGLSDQVPWGLWIVIDLSAISMGGGAFVLGAIVYLLRLNRYANIGKVAILLGFLGYSTAALVLFFDIGQPLRFWHPIVYWQTHSLLWEITMCVVLYLTVLLLELFPTVVEHPIFDRFPILAKLVHLIHRIGPALAVMGLTLSLLHQASLGATYGVLSGRGIWFSPSAPVQFVLSAIGGGLSLLFIACVFIFRVMRPGVVKDDHLYDVARLSGVFLLLFFYLLLWDWAVTNYYSFDNQISGQLELLNTVAPYSLTFWVGQVLFTLLPGLILMTSKRSRNLRLAIFAAFLGITATLLLRWNYNFSGLIASITYDPFTPTVKLNSYIPTWQELALGTGVIAYWFLGFSMAARFLPFSDRGHSQHQPPAE